MTTILDLIESFKGDTKTALIYHNGFRTFFYSYDELYNRIQQTAEMYRAKGIQAGDRVGLWGPNQPEWVFAYFGAIMIGAVVVPIDIQSQPETARRIIAHSGARFLIKSQSRLLFLQEVPTMILEDLEYEIKKTNPKVPLHIAKSTDLVEIVYTSGTTGDPKGVMLSHENIVADIAGIKDHFVFRTADTVLSVLPLSHMLEQTCGLLTPLSCNMTIVYTHALTPTSIFAALKRHRITIMIVVPRILEAMQRSIMARLSESLIGKQMMRRTTKKQSLPLWMRRILFYPIHHAFGSSFRLFVSGGAHLPEQTEIFWDRIGFTLVQGYGLTECAPVLSATREHAKKVGSVGRPLSIAEIRVSNEGEILTKGKNVFSGYFNDFQKTAEAFDGEWFKTGDTGYFDEDGDLFIKGRKNDVIITSAGKNVYPDDIEAVLNTCGGVKEACVFGHMMDSGEEVIAVIVPDSAAVSAAQVLAQANAKLDSSQRIHQMFFWNEPQLPKTTTLKIKRPLVRAVIQRRLRGTEPLTGHDATAHTKLDWMIAEVTGQPLEHILDTSTLSRDLKLDSIGRAELSALVTREYNFDFEEELIGEETTVGDVRDFIERRVVKKSAWKQALWPHWKLMWPLRMMGMELIYGNAARLFTRLTVQGREHVDALRGPVLFAANHVSYGDHTNIFRALPFRYRYRIAFPAWAEFFESAPNSSSLDKFFKRAAFYWTSVTLGLFLLPTRNYQRKGLEHIGTLIDSGESILIFPEGGHATTSELLPFKKGTALLAQQLRIPVVPIGHRGMEYIFPHHALFPRFGRMTITFGQPFYVEQQTLEEATRFLRDEIDRLRRM